VKAGAPTSLTRNYNSQRAYGKNHKNKKTPEVAAIDNSLEIQRPMSNIMVKEMTLNIRLNIRRRRLTNKLWVSETWRQENLIRKSN